MSEPLTDSKHIVSTITPAAFQPALAPAPELPTVVIPATRFEEAAALLNVMEGRLETMRDDSNFAFEQLVDDMRRKYHALTLRLRDEKAEEILRLKKLLSTSSGG